MSHHNETQIHSIHQLGPSVVPRRRQRRIVVVVVVAKTLREEKDVNNSHAPAASSLAHGPPSAASNGPRLCRHSESAGESGVTLSVPSPCAASRALPLGALLPEPPDPPFDAVDFVLSDALLFDDEPSALAVPLAPFAPVGSVAPGASPGAFAVFAAASFIVGAASSAPGASDSAAAARAILLVWTRGSRGAGSASSRVRARRCADDDGWVVRRCVGCVSKPYGVFSEL